jgi:hypothetical protein
LEALMPHYLHPNLCKGGSAAKLGGQKGGKYVARVQVGFKPDNSPKYRYFESKHEYQAYLSEQGKASKEDTKAKRKKEKLKRKMTKEQGKKKHGGKEHDDALSLVVGKKKKKVKKSVSLFVGADDE